MSADTVGTTIDEWGATVGERSHAEWRRLYQRHGEEFGRVADAVGESKREVLEAFVEIGIVEPTAPFYVRRFYPQDIGLSPLNCARCGEMDIESHPCPECGFDPREGGGEA